MNELPNFSQKDPRWKLKRVGTGTLTFGSVGCVICAVADLLNYYGYQVTPDQLNDALVANNGFADQNLLKWEVVTKIYPNVKWEKRVDERNRYDLVDEYLSQKKPVIGCIDYDPKTLVLDQHFIVFKEKDSAGNYLIHDPMCNPGDGAYYLHAKYDPNKLWGLRLYSGPIEQPKTDVVENQTTIVQYERFLSDLREVLRCDSDNFAAIIGKAESLRVSANSHKDFVESVAESIGCPSDEDKAVLEALQTAITTISTDILTLKNKQLMEFDKKDLLWGFITKLIYRK